MQRHRRLVDRSTKAALGSIDNPSSLPPPSADYWEVKETKLTLATAAVLCAGLESGAELYRILGDVGAADQATAGARRLRAAISATFGKNGYPRRLGGRSDSTDLGVDFLLPPLGSTVDRTVVHAWEQAPVLMWRPAGGLAPGGSWRRDGVSWTNVTASRAMTAAFLGRARRGVGAVALARPAPYGCRLAAGEGLARRPARLGGAACVDSRGRRDHGRPAGPRRRRRANQLTGRVRVSGS